MSAYGTRVTACRLADGTVIVDVMGTDPDPDGPDGIRWVGFDAAGLRRWWYTPEIVERTDVEWSLRTTWVEECMAKQGAGR